MSATAGSVQLLAADASVVDLVGYGAATVFEGSAPAPGLSNSTSGSRSATGTDTDQNAADLTAGAPDPQNTGSGSTEPPAEPTPATIEEIQGTGSTSPLAGKPVTTSGVVTAAYPTGGLAGFYLQTPGTGGDVDPASHTGSDAVFVFLGSGTPAASYPAVGDHVEVTGTVSEFNGLTEVSPGSTGSVKPLGDTVAQPTPARIGWPSTDTERETFEGMLVAPQGDYTVTDTFTINNFGEVGLARGRSPLPQPTDVAAPGSAAQAVAADNATKAVTLDDGSSTNYLTSGKNDALPYLTDQGPVRVGQSVSFSQPVVVDYRFDRWRFQPRSQVQPGNGASPVTFTGARPAAPAAVGGDLKIASFNVLNSFKETGSDWVADGGTCSSFNDRAGTPVTVNSCNGDGPRGAWDTENRLRQQAKVVRAINTLDADVLSLEEIENSAKYAGADRRDDALADLVQALNADAGTDRWAFVPSPPAADRPAVADEDVIRTAFIYQPAAVEPVGPSHILVGSAAFANAREPLGQVFQPVGGKPDQRFLAVVNHFKSKGSGVDDGTGQGNANPDRVRQARDLVAFVRDLKAGTGTEKVFLTGDFNSYTREDPMQYLYDAGYTDIGEAKAPGEYTYLFDGVVGSLDHVLANDAMLGNVTGAHVWNINSVESVAYEYSRYNYNKTLFYAPDQFRSSDHDPLLVGFDDPAAPVATSVSASAAPDRVVVRDTEATVTARVGSEDGPVDSGTVQVLRDGTVLGSGEVSGGEATVRLPAFDSTGAQHLTVAYAGTSAAQPSSTSVTVTVVKAMPSLDVAVQPATIHKGKTAPRLVVSLTAPGQTVTGFVAAQSDGETADLRELGDGRATLTLPTYKKRGDYLVTVRYLGSDLAEAVSRDVVVHVEN
ncbi:MAG: ExeM/NucH family extracellular endonuclease [Nocardioidaceae bacterium]|nr:ExeM/NucH family extracellular endonuclease [Nocardioidaceae bacterium]